MEPIEIPQKSVTSLAIEATGMLQLIRLAGAWPRLARLPGGSGENIIVMPGFGMGDGTTLPLRRFLTRKGFAARTWGLGRNDGDVWRIVPQLLEQLDKTTGPVSLIGWSLGGYIAREVAREAPQRIRRVITLGTPVVGGPKYTLVGNDYAAKGYDLDRIEAEVAARESTPILTPITAIFSKSDRVVAWQACIDRCSPQVEHIEVGTTHLGLGLSPTSYEIILRRLLPRRASSDTPLEKVSH